MEDEMMRACFESDAPLTNQERKHQAEMETMLDELCDREREEQNRREAEAARRAFKRGLMLGIKTE